MGSGANWRKIISGLSGDRVLVYDQRGHGRSWQPEAGYSSDDYADDLHKILLELGWDHVFLVGHSMGGRNALAFADRFSSFLAGLVIEDIGPDPNPEAVAYYRNLLDLVPTPFATRNVAKSFFQTEWPHLPVAAENPVTLGQYFYSNLDEKEDGTLDWRFSRSGILASVSQGRAKDMWRELRNLSIPTLVVRGANSRELKPDVFARMAVANPRVQSAVISNAGHWIHADQPQEFLRIILEFARSCST